MSRLFLLTIGIIGLFHTSYGQVDTCLSTVKKHVIQSEHLGESREFWVSLPLWYDEDESYPVLYVLDAEWRLEMISRIVYDLGGNKKIPRHIVVGIPHVDWREQRGIDLTFSHSNIEYDGELVDSSLYNDSNSGSGELFYQYLTKELMPAVEQAYACNGENILVGHSYGGYFGSYILGRDHNFSALQIYDPSIWFSQGEAIREVKSKLAEEKELHVFISYQPVPVYHKEKIEELIETLSSYDKIDLGYKLYPDETHNSLFLPSFLEGIKHFYRDWKKD